MKRFTVNKFLVFFVFFAHQGIGAVPTLSSFKRTIAHSTNLSLKDFPGLSGLPLPPQISNKLNSIKLENVKQRTVGNRHVVTGTANFLEHKADITITTVIYANQLKSVFVISLPDTWRFSKTFGKDFKALDGLELSKAAFAVSSARYEDKDRKVTFGKGFNLVGTAKLGDLLAKIVGPQTFILQGLITTDPKLIGSKLSAKIPTNIKLAKGFTSTDVTFKVAIGSGPGGIPVVRMRLGTNISVVVPKQDEPLIFGTTIAAGPFKANLSGKMDGFWENPLGVKGIKIGNLGLTGIVDYAAAAATGITGLGIRGDIQVGTKTFEAAVLGEFGSVGGNVIIDGALKGGLKLTDMASFAGLIMGKKLKVKGLPDLGFNNAQLYIAVQGGAIAGKRYAKGVAFSADTKLFGKKAFMDIKVNERDGLRGNGYLQAVTLGPLKITGPGPDKKQGTKDDGASVSLVLGLFKQKLAVAGRAQLDKAVFGGFSSDVNIKASLKGVNFKVNQNVFGTFKAQYAFFSKANIQNVKASNLSMKVTIEQDALKKLEQTLHKAARVIENNAKRDLGKARAKLTKAQKGFGDLSKLKRRLDAATKRCTK